MNKYIFFYGGKQTTIEAATLSEAKDKAVAFFKPPKSKRHMVHGMIAERADGTEVTHSTAAL